ncbi:hypothetical protein [Devosia rhizoryzae]|uniref:DUF883 domain-containing protein n=1 Tax=Devosia rhizoryzae TaxID=2774137 RepID=A0ABX7C8Q1_9HYPH|nr:hypothetical protein [Devosia rhizoryzae]QQR40657.1 hypothetical protein JI748_06570 [Devosia rhizoryzae]
MNLDHLLSQLTGRRQESPLEAQLRQLRREISRISEAVAHEAGHAAHDWGKQAGHTANDWGRSAGHAANDWGRHAGHAANDLSRQVGHLANEWGDELAVLGREAAKRGAEIAEFAAYKAGRGAKALRSDPLPAIAIIGTALLAAQLFKRR